VLPVVPSSTPTADAVATLAKHYDVNDSDKEMADRENHFAFDLFHSVDSKAGSDNSFISPLSIDQAMTMLYDGANGQTQSEIANALHIGGFKRSDVDTDTSELRRYIDGPDPQVQIEIANALWADKRISFTPAYQDECAKYFDASATTLDFTFPTASATINS
jgi:serpin B